MSLPKICTCPTVPAADCPFHHQDACGSLAAMPCCASSDSARLDWLQANQKTVWRCSHEERRPTTMTDGETERVSVFDGWTVDDEEHMKPTIREAIDHAISQHNSKL